MELTSASPSMTPTICFEPSTISVSEEMRIRDWIGSASVESASMDTGSYFPEESRSVAENSRFAGSDAT